MVIKNNNFSARIRREARLLLNTCFNIAYSLFFKRGYWVSNYHLIPKKSKFFQPLRGFDKNSDVLEMRKFYRDNGYLYVKGLLDLKRLNALNDKCFKLFQEYDFDVAIQQIQQLNEFQELTADAFWEKLMFDTMGATCSTYKRKVIRRKSSFFPQSTGVHYDKTYMRKGEGEVFNIWIPVCDIPIGGGAITYLKDSLKIGTDLEMKHNKAVEHLPASQKIIAYSKSLQIYDWISKDLVGVAKRYNTQWLANNYKAGDVVIHNSYILHASFANYQEDRKNRLSIDIRLQNLDSKMDDRWQNNWSRNDGL